MKILESYSGGVSNAAENRFRVRLITEGQGSSGFYTAEVLERDLPAAMPKGTKVYFDHMSEAEMDSGRARSMQNLVGVFDSDPVVEGGEGFALVRFYENSPTYKDVPQFIAEAMDDIGVSIEIHAGLIGEGGVVEALNFSPHNSLAIVTNPGARGRVEALAENFRTPAEGSTITERQAMTPEEIQAITSPIIEAIKSLREELSPVTEEVEGPTHAAVAEAIVSAKLTDQGRAAVYAGIESGVSVEEAIKTEVAREKAILEALSTSQEGNLQESGVKDYDAAFTATLKGN